VEEVAALGSTVLILGETGTGKELQVAEGAFTPTGFGKR
jgi:transcriptional regulator with GAF, ATPase, and Fis domain